MNKSVKRVACAVSALTLAFALSGCAKDTKNAEPSKEASASQAKDAGDEGKDDAEEEEGKGFKEAPIGDGVGKKVGPLEVKAVFFQPVPMEPEGAAGTPAAEASMHIEADISAMKNNELGYGAGDFIPGLTVHYQVLGEGGKVATEGTFMPMNASDGPHYGINLPKMDAGTYTLKVTIESPEKNGWLLHTDKETGVKGRFWTEPLVAEFTDWHWDPETSPWW